MRLNKIKLVNFKKHKTLSQTFGDVTELIGCNEAGKTSIYDGFLDCLFGCDSLGQADFMRHHNYDEQLIVEEEVELDGVVYRKEYHPKKPMKRCWINGESLPIRKYEAAVASVMDKDRFRMLTDVGYVLGMTQDSCRALLTSICDPAEPEGFDRFRGEDLQKLKKLLTDEKARLEKARDAAGYRIDEIKRELADQSGDHATTQARKKALQDQLQGLKDELHKIKIKQAERDQCQDRIAELRAKLKEREVELRTDTRRVQQYIDERAKLLTVQMPDLRGLEIDIQAKKDLLWQAQQNMIRMQNELESCRQAWPAVNNNPPEKPEYATGCPTCGQPLPDDQVEQAKAKAESRYMELLGMHSAKLDEITQRGNDLMAQITATQNNLETMEQDLQTLQGENLAEEAKAEREDAQRQARIAELDKLIEADEKVKPEDDKVWQGIQAQIDEVPLGEDVSGQIEIITGQMDGVQSELDGVNEVLNTWERQERDRKRVKELKAELVGHVEKLRQIAHDLAELRKYKVASAKCLEDAVNGLFKHVSWKLFRDLKTTDEQEPCCIAVLERDGVQVEYKNWSQGMRIAGGIDIITTLSNHYGIVVPLFLDNYESYSLGIRAPGQEIRMIVDKSQWTLKIKG